MRADAFGRIDGSVPALRTVGERLTEGVVSLSGLWGVLSGAAALAVVFGVWLSRRSAAGLVLMIGASVANAVFVPVTLLYLHDKAPEIRAMTEEHDELRTALGDIVTTLLGGGPESGAGATQQATAALTNQGFACGLVAVVTAVIAISMGNRFRSIVSGAGTRNEVSQRSRTGEPPARRREAAHDVEDVLKRLELAVPLGHASHPVRADLDDQPGEAGKQRILPRAAVARRNDNQAGQTRRERPTARRARPRPANRASATPQPATGAAAPRSGRWAQPAPASIAQRQRTQR
ncbi:hypothetical protein [Nocardia sp. NPDC051750]|uniref:hypothetical protein n=1 Tax=Nocardia sp. NPDC051750 TaxID=3364325 RepID=UPI0037A45C2D